MDDFADQTYVLVVEDHPSTQKVRMSRDIYIGKHITLYPQKRDQTTNTET